MPFDSKALKAAVRRLFKSFDFNDPNLPPGMKDKIQSDLRDASFQRAWGRRTAKGEPLGSGVIDIRDYGMSEDDPFEDVLEDLVERLDDALSRQQNLDIRSREAFKRGMDEVFEYRVGLEDFITVADEMVANTTNPINRIIVEQARDEVRRLAWPLQRGAISQMENMHRFRDTWLKHVQLDPQGARKLKSYKLKDYMPEGAPGDEVPPVFQYPTFFEGMPSDTELDLGHSLAVEQGLERTKKRLFMEPPWIKDAFEPQGTQQQDFLTNLTRYFENPEVERRTFMLRAALNRSNDRLEEDLNRVLIAGWKDQPQSPTHALFEELVNRDWTLRGNQSLPKQVQRNQELTTVLNSIGREMDLTNPQVIKHWRDAAQESMTAGSAVGGVLLNLAARDPQFGMPPAASRNFARGFLSLRETEREIMNTSREIAGMRTPAYRNLNERFNYLMSSPEYQGMTPIAAAAGGAGLFDVSASQGLFETPPWNQLLFEDAPKKVGAIAVEEAAEGMVMGGALASAKKLAGTPVGRLVTRAAQAPALRGVGGIIGRSMPVVGQGMLAAYGGQLAGDAAAAVMGGRLMNESRMKAIGGLPQRYPGESDIGYHMRRAAQPPTIPRYYEPLRPEPELPPAEIRYGNQIPGPVDPRQWQHYQRPYTERLP